MECNKDEATRAKAIAEAKLVKKDYVGAKKFSSKAQSLYPGLDGISQMLTTLDVYLSAEKKIFGEVDWYGVLGVNPSVDDETIKKQYKKLALMLHPDKNKSIGADGAFKLISEAWSFLSNKEKRLEYNKRRGYKGFQQNARAQTCGPSAPSRPSQPKVPTQTGGPSAPSRPSQQKGPNQSSNCASRKTSAPKPQSRSAKGPSKPTPAPAQQKIDTDTFWTTCYECNTKYEFVKIYLNYPLLCRQCQKPFMASETDPPPANFFKSAKMLRRRSSVDNSAAKKSGVGQGGQSSFGCGNNQQGPLPGTADTGVKEPSIASKVNDDVQKRPRVESFGWEKFFKRSRLGNDSGGIAHGHSGLGTASEEKCKTKESNEEKYGCNSCADNVKGHPKVVVINVPGSDFHNFEEKCKSKESNEEKCGCNSCTDNVKGHPKVVAINVPGSDFHNFDADRCESSFSDNDIWAAYDNDGMPRSYALISKVVSRAPFELSVSWLTVKTNSESSNICVGPGLHKACGVFRVSGRETCTSVNTFSHRVNCSKGHLGGIIILPQKGEFWALYKNGAVHKFDMVMVLDNYCGKRGVLVAPLVKVAGFRTVFLPNLDPAGSHRITKEDLSRFSHRVPHYFLSREEAPNAPEGTVELDPAATPLQLLQIVTETGGL